MSNKLINYPIFRIEVSDKCANRVDIKIPCEFSDIKLKVVGIKALPESYISQLYCSDRGALINAMAQAEIHPECQSDIRYPLNGFLIEKTGMASGDLQKYLANFQE